MRCHGTVTGVVCVCVRVCVCVVMRPAAEFGTYFHVFLPTLNAA